ncbi:hypothetical protein EMEDMD4_150125 [Sinorhizobium medicae]|uniref:Uncharacterized protein n=1 Tax=Sinorhizobium medicae TaxID=110321 RepID=A0A508WSI1_9HYPH|nr:hypothetical protein EMEDMD4_150125 [Sinorhizobium medicae]
MRYLSTQQLHRFFITAMIVHAVQPTVHKIARLSVLHSRIVSILLESDRPFSPDRKRRLAQECTIVPKD